jgi:hypothetical protein
MPGARFSPRPFIRPSAWMLVAFLFFSGCTLVALAEQTADEPATVRQALEVVNLKTLTTLNPVSFWRGSPTHCSYTSKASFASAKAFFRAEVTNSGWKELAPVSAETDVYFDYVYAKKGFLLRVTIYPRSADQSEIDLNSYGNIEAAVLPRPRDLEPVGKSFPISCACFASGSFDAIVAAVRGSLQPCGWHEYVSSGRLPSDPDKIRMLDFRANGVNIQVIVYRHPNGKPLVGYVLMPMSAFDVPLPRDAAGVQVENEDSLGEGRVTFTTRQSASEFKAFLREAASRLGWSDQTPKSVDDSLVFTTPAKRRHVANLSPAKGGATRVDFVAFPEPTNVIAKTADAPPSAPVDRPDRPKEVKNASDKREEKPAADLANAAESFPLPSSALDVVRDPVRKEIRLATNDDADAQIAFFESALKSLGWDKNADNRGNVNENVNAYLQFMKDDLYLGLEIHYVAATRRTDTTISGNGLRFSPGASVPASDPAKAPASALTVKDVKGLPVPSSSENLADEASPYRRSLDTSVTAKLARVVALYRKEMPGRGFQEAPTSKVSAGKATLIFTGADSELTVTLSRSGHNVKIAIVERHPEAARRDNMVPLASKARLVLANQTSNDITITINGAPYSVKAGMGAKGPAEAFKVDLFPGTNKLVAKVPGKADQSVDVPVAEGETWGLAIFPGGELFVPVQFY